VPRADANREGPFAVRPAGQLTVEEWAVLERLAGCRALVEELYGLDHDRFLAGLAVLERMVLALADKRPSVIRTQGGVFHDSPTRTF